MNRTGHCPVCGKENTSGQARCVCGCLLERADPLIEEAETAFDLNFLEARRIAGQRVFLDGPWYQPLEVKGTMMFGRGAELPPEIRQSLEAKFDNVSRRHAELRHEQGEIWIVDLGSSNGTFVNEVKLEPHRPVRLGNGARVRFAADLTVTLRIEAAAN